MLKNVRYLLLLMALIALAGCETVNGASQGAQKDIKNTWHNAQKADAWMQQHMW